MADSSINTPAGGAARVEREAAETILQRPFTVRVGEREYRVPQPTVATIILASEAISRLPDVRPDPGDIIKSSLAIAPECGALGEITAILILGAKEADRPVRVGKRGGIRRLFGPRRKRTATAREVLAREVLEEMTVDQMFRTVSTIIGKMNLGSFFGLTTFLTETNLLRPTKVAAGTTGATASGL